MRKETLLAIVICLPIFLGMAYFQWWVRDFELMQDAKIYAYFDVDPRYNMDGMRYDLMCEVKNQKEIVWWGDEYITKYSDIKKRK